MKEEDEKENLSSDSEGNISSLEKSQLNQEITKDEQNKEGVQEISLNLLHDDHETHNANDDPVTSARENWGNKAQFLLATIGLSVGLGNLWRFPYLCQKNGGGVFLIPFFIFIFIEGIPLFFIELGVGQRFRRTTIEVWRGIHKSLTGIGISSMLVSVLLCMYYIIIIAWAIFYLYLSMRSDLPWHRRNCDNYEIYEEIERKYENVTVMLNVSVTSKHKEFYENQSKILKGKLLEHSSCCIQDAPQYQWYEKTLRVSTNIEDAGIGINTNLLIALLFAWLMVYVCIMKGIKSSGKAVYFTATFPYVILLILFFRGITLPGAADGIKEMFNPKFEKLLESQIWLDAATQVFFSLSLGFGALIAFASYNPINNNIVRDAYVIVFTDCFTALFGGLVVYSILGYRQHEKGTPIDKGAIGLGLAFISFSDVLLLMDVSPLWAILFFFMLILLGIDSEFGILEGVVAPLYDLKIVKMKKFIFLPIIIAAMFLVDLSMIAGFGFYVFQIFDSYAVTIPLLVIALAQCIAIGWVYGTDKFADDFEFMTGKRPWVFWMVCWKYLSPIGLLIILLWVLADTIRIEPTYDVYVGCTIGDAGKSWTKEMPYPTWARIIGGMMVAGTLIPIPIFLIIERPKNWIALLKKQFCSGLANYMPDPAAWRERNCANSMLYEPAYYSPPTEEKL